MKNKKISSPNLFIALIVIWELFSISGAVNTFVLPAAHTVFIDIIKMLFTGSFYEDAFFSTYRVLTAFIFALIVALPLAVAISEVKLIEQLFVPVIDYARYLPVPALIPLLIIFFGVGEMSKIALLFFGIVFQYTLILLDNIRRIPREYHDLLFTLNITTTKRVIFIVRQALPDIYDCARIMVGWCWTYVIIAELVASEAGLGHLIKESQRLADIPRVYSGIIAMGLIGFFTDFLFRYYYPKLFAYKNDRN